MSKSSKGSSAQRIAQQEIKLGHPLLNCRETDKQAPVRPSAPLMKMSNRRAMARRVTKLLRKVQDQLNSNQVERLREVYNVIMSGTASRDQFNTLDKLFGKVK